MEQSDEPTFTNQHGTFHDGDRVWFEVENQVSGGWLLPTHGSLCYIEGEWFVRVSTDKGETFLITINKGYDIYGGAIRKPIKSLREQIFDALERQAKGLEH